MGRSIVFPVAISIFFFTFLANKDKLDGTKEADTIHGVVLFFLIICFLAFFVFVHASRRSLEVKASRVYHKCKGKEKVHWIDQSTLYLFSFFDLEKDWRVEYPQLRKHLHKVIQGEDIQISSIRLDQQVGEREREIQLGQL